MIRSKKIKIEKARELISKKVKIDDEENLLDFVLNKLDISKKEFDEILKKENKNFKNFFTYYDILKYFKFIIHLMTKIKLLPKILYLKYFS